MKLIVEIVTLNMTVPPEVNVTEDLLVDALRSPCVEPRR